MSKYRKKPVVIEAEKFDPEDSIPPDVEVVSLNDKKAYFVPTLEGDMSVRPGDFIITGVKGERYPCRADIFEETYEPADEAGPIDWEEYRTGVLRTANSSLSWQQRVAMGSMGLSGETGEIVDYLKKGLFHGHDIAPDKVRDELGDVLWYLTFLGNLFELSLEEIAQENLGKLRRRYPEGFDPEKSKGRES